MPDSTDPIESTLSRRRLLRAGLGVAVATALAACSGDDEPQAAGSAQSSPTTGPPTTTTAATTAPPGGAGGSPTTLAPTPACVDDDDVTPAQTEGPYFKPSSPEKSNLFADVTSGTRLVVSGSVLTTACQPVNRAQIEVWQADNGGNYDNTTYRLRGHLFSDAQGRYRFETIMPGLYPGRTRHIHVKVQPPNGRVLTTQLYFPGEAQNARDGIYSRELEMDVRDVANGKEANFDFVLNT